MATLACQRDSRCLVGKHDAHSRGRACLAVSYSNNMTLHIANSQSIKTFTSPDKLDSSTRQVPCSRTKSHVAVPGSTTTTSPGTSLLEDVALRTLLAASITSRVAFG